MEACKSLIALFCAWKSEYLKMTSKRLLYLDSLRGFAILLVVVGHLIQYNYEDGLANPLFNIIYSFHMPFFFFLSGCSRSVYETIKGVRIRNIKENIKEIIAKFAALIIPSVVWTIMVPNFFKREFSFHIAAISSYWFLNILFVIYVVWSVVSLAYNKFSSKWPIVTVFVCVVLVCFSFNIYRIPLTYLCFFVLGYLWQHFSLSKRIPTLVILLCTVLFLLLVGVYRYGESTAGDPNRVWLMIPLSLMASIVLHYMFSRGELNYRCLEVLGKYSLGIYLCHYFLIRMPAVRHLQNSLPAICELLVLMLIAVVVSYVCVLIQIIVKQNEWLNALFYGNWKFLKRNESNS